MDKHESQKGRKGDHYYSFLQEFSFFNLDYSLGFGGKFGVQKDRQDKSAVGWEHREKVAKHDSQKGTFLINKFIAFISHQLFINNLTLKIIRLALVANLACKRTVWINLRLDGNIMKKWINMNPKKVRVTNSIN